MNKPSVKEQLANIDNEDKYFLKMEELAEDNGITEDDQRFILDSCCVSGRTVLTHTTIASILDEYSNGEDEVLNQGITMNISLSDAQIKRLGPKLDQDSFSNLIGTQGIEKTLKLLGNILTLSEGKIAVSSDYSNFEIESLIADKDMELFKKIANEHVFKPYLSKDAIAILKDNQDKPVLIKCLYSNELSGIDFIDNVELYTDLNWSLDKKALSTSEIITELEKLKPEMHLYIWFDGDRHFIKSIEVLEDKIIIKGKDH